jgi:hypothetical protein
VIAFVIVTSIVNIGLGYALAVYLRKETAWSTPTPHETMMTADVAAVLARANAAADASLHLQSQPGALSWPPDQAAASAAKTGALSPAQPAAEPAGLKFAADAPREDERPLARSAEMDQDLLAGIEEFRNQLAQLKGQGVDGVVHNPLAAGASI